MVSSNGPHRVADGHVPPSGAWQRRDWDHHRELVRASNRARTVAIRQLIEEFPDEWDRIYAEQCALEDPPVTPRSRRPTDAEMLEAEIAKLKRQLSELEGDGE